VFAREGAFPLRYRMLRWIGQAGWLRYGQHRLLRRIHDPEYGPHFLFEVDFFGQRYRGDMAHYIDWLVFCYGGAPYCELSLLRAVAPELRAGRDGALSFFDIGANVGHHTLFMAPLADRVIAFEPLPALRELIAEKIELNALTNVDVLPVALGDADEERDYFVGRGANSGEGSFLPEGEFDRGNLVSLPIRRGDRFFEEKHLPRIDLMKVDVEGFEPYVFRGLAGRIRRDRPVILTELSDNSRRGFGSAAAFQSSFYDDARFAAVTGGFGKEFRLRRFDYETSDEVLIVPPEMAGFLQRNGLS